MDVVVICYARLHFRDDPVKNTQYRVNLYTISSVAFVMSQNRVGSHQPKSYLKLNFTHAYDRKGYQS